MSEPIRILLVDDQKIVTETMSYMMRQKGYVVDIAHEAETGIALAKKNQYDVIFADYLMPGDLGTEMIRKIREFDKKVSVVFITGSPDERMIRETEGLNIAGFFSKKDGIAELDQVIGVVLRGIERSRDKK